MNIGTIEIIFAILSVGAIIGGFAYLFMKNRNRCVCGHLKGIHSTSLYPVDRFTKVKEAGCMTCACSRYQEKL